jgi:hypothetical protein
MFGAAGPEPPLLWSMTAPYKARLATVKAQSDVEKRKSARGGAADAACDQGRRAPIEVVSPAQLACPQTRVCATSNGSEMLRHEPFVTY